MFFHPDVDIPPQMKRLKTIHFCFWIPTKKPKFVSCTNSRNNAAMS